MVEPPRVPMLARAWNAYGARDMPRTAWLLALGGLLLGTGRGLVGPYIVLFLVQERGLSLALVGAGITLEFALRAFVGPVAGGLSDRIGRKPLMLLGVASTAVLLPSYLLVTQPWHYVVLSVLNGTVAAHSLYGPAANALVADVVPPRHRGLAYGTMHAARNLGFTVGILLGLLLAREATGPAFLAASLLQLAFLGVLARFVHAPATPRDEAAVAPRAPMWHDWRALLRVPLFPAFLAFTVACYLAWGAINTIFPLFVTEGLGLARGAVTLIGINSAIIFLFQIPFGRLTDTAPRFALLAVAALVLALAYAAFAGATQVASGTVWLALLSGMLLLTLGEMLYTPLLTAATADLAPRGATGSALGMLSITQAVGIGAPPLIADALVPRGGWGLAWGVLAFASAVAALGLAVLARKALRVRP